MLGRKTIFPALVPQKCGVCGVGGYVVSVHIKHYLVMHIILWGLPCIS